MSGAGHMSKLVRLNNSKTKQRKERVLNYKKSIDSYSSTTTKLEFKTVSTKELNQIKEVNLIKIRNGELRRLLTFIGIALIILLLVFSFRKQFI